MSIKKTYQFVNEMKERFDRKMCKKVSPERTESLEQIYDRLQRKNEKYFINNSTEDKDKPTTQTGLLDSAAHFGAVTPK